MNIYVLQCISNREDKVRQQLTSLAPNLTIHIPRRRMINRKAGKPVEEEYMLFPGYVFIELDSPDASLVPLLREIPHALKFLPRNEEMRPLHRDDEELMRRLLKTGEVIGSSLVNFNADNRIEVVQGPLEGLEGKIIKVDKRKRRARVRLDMYEKTFEIDFPFSDLKKPVQ